MTDQDRSYLNKIDPQTASTLLSLPEGQDPMVSVAVEWRVTPSAAEMAVIAASGGQWQNPAGAGMAPSSIQTLRLPLRAGEGLAIGGKHQPRLQQHADVLQLGVVLGHQRIGRRHRAIGHAEIQGRAGQLQVFQIVAGENQQRPLDRQIEIQQALGDAAHAPEHLGIADPLPLAIGAAPGDKGLLGTLLGPAQQALEQALRISLQRLQRLHIQRLPGLAQLHRRHADRYRPVDRLDATARWVVHL